MCTFMYATPTFRTEALRLVTQVHLFLTTVTVNYCIAQNFGGVNFWRMKLKDAFG